jgi:hypothetical protein
MQQDATRCNELQISRQHGRIAFIASSQSIRQPINMSINKHAARHEIVSQCTTLGHFYKERRTTKSAAHTALNTAFRKFVARKRSADDASVNKDELWVGYRERLLRIAAKRAKDGDDDSSATNEPPAISSIVAPSPVPPRSANAFEDDLSRLLDSAMPRLYVACRGQLPESMRHPTTPFQRLVAESFASFVHQSEHEIRSLCTQRQTKGLIAWMKELKRRPVSSFSDSALVSLRCVLSYRPWSYDVGDVATAGRDGLVVVVRTWDDADIEQRIYWAVRLEDAQRNPPVLDPRLFLDEDLTDADTAVVKPHKAIVRLIIADRQCTERLVRIEEMTQDTGAMDDDYMSAEGVE